MTRCKRHEAERIGRDAIDRMRGAEDAMHGTRCAMHFALRRRHPTENAIDLRTHAAKPAACSCTLVTRLAATSSVT